MSFVYAEKNETNESKEIIAYSDTRIGFTDYSGASFADEELELIKKYGIIKHTILCSEICVSFAGNNIALAGLLFDRLQKKSCFTTDEVIALAYDIHSNADNSSDIEFIISSCENHAFRIACIKENILKKDCPSAWIGSQQAFEEFQMYRRDTSGIENRSINSMSSAAFRRVVEGCLDDSVGGFPIRVMTSDQTWGFHYLEEISFFSSKEQIIYPGESVTFYTSAADGGMSYRIIAPTITAVILSIDQMDADILYSRNLRTSDSSCENKNLQGLMLPMEIVKRENGEWKRKPAK